MPDSNILLVVAGFSLVYAVASIAGLLIENKRLHKFLTIMQPTFHVSMVLVAMSGLGYIK